MNIDRNNIDELTARLTVTVEPADYENRVEKILNDYRKNSQYPGFRKGKAPMALIRKQYAAPVLADEMNKIISEELSAYIQKEQLDILGNPIPETSTEASGDWEKPENFTFAYEIGLAPKIDLKFGWGAKFTRHIIKVDKKAIEAAITDHMRRHGSISEQEEASDKDLLLGHFTQLDASGAPLVGGI
jgi:trigger factor